MPWKGETDPYRIWLSEIILQQTRVDQGLEYYQNFIKTFPDVHSLAAAPEERVFKLWEGLGYYTRCRNLIASARYISTELNGRFPGTFEEIKKLKGVGPYTASAVASFAYNLPYAVLDGNVFRVLSRIFGEYTAIDSTEGRKIFASLAEQLLDKENPARYNQAIMDFGASVCKPAPVCSACPFRDQCFAFLNNAIAELPYKAKRTTIKKRWFYFLVIEHNGLIAIRQRTGKDIWQQLYEYPMVESNSEVSAKEAFSSAQQAGFFQTSKVELLECSPIFKQQLSHQLISGQFLRITAKKRPEGANNWIWLPMAEITKYPFPRLIHSFFERGYVI
jgi:A/G-specific adenine glycosylase